MILFLGDSFTWGQGLHYYHMIENEGWTWDDCRTFLKKVNHFESLGWEADEFRKQNHFPALVGKELNLPIITPSAENGGDNFKIYKILKNIELFVTQTNVDYVVIQFSAPNRSLLNSPDEIQLPTIEEFIEHSVDRIVEVLNEKKLKWFAVSWFPEISDILKDKYKENHIPILYKGKEFDSFEFMRQTELKDLTIQYTQNIDDGHFNLEGHRVIADSIITKIKGN